MTSRRWTRGICTPRLSLGGGGGGGGLKFALVLELIGNSY